MSDVRQKGPDEIFCSSCGAIIKKEAEICPKCGVRQKDAPSQNEDDYGLGKPLSAWNVYKVKNPEKFGGFSSGVYRLLSFLSLGWLLGLILFIVTQSSKNTKLRKTQGKAFLISAIVGFIFWTLYQVFVTL